MPPQTGGPYSSLWPPSSPLCTGPSSLVVAALLLHRWVLLPPWTLAQGACMLPLWAACAPFLRPITSVGSARVCLPIFSCQRIVPRPIFRILSDQRVVRDPEGPTLPIQARRSLFTEDGPRLSLRTQSQGRRSVPPGGQEELSPRPWGRARRISRPNASAEFGHLAP